jgi:hypothetical protein
MDSGERDVLIAALQAEMLRSLKLAMEQSELWNRRQRALKRHYGSGYENRIAKRDDQMLKDFLSAYTWHRDNSAWAWTMIQMLRSEYGAVPDRPRTPTRALGQDGGDHWSRNGDL